jgi:membrane-associated PAP2 superfamily phosphatase
MTAPASTATPRQPGPGWRRDLTVTVLALAAVLAWDLTGLDLPLTRLWGHAGGFPWRDHLLTATLVHEGGRWLAGLGLAALAWDVWRPLLPGPTRAQRAATLAFVVASMALVPLHKRISLTSCPWSLREFGGGAEYVSHWLPGVADGGPGGCFPSGHAVTAFGFFALYFLWRGHRPALARAVLAAVLAAGALFAWAQLARGAHYLSHSLWSAWLCWALAALAFRYVPAFSRATKAA